MNHFTNLPCWLLERDIRAKNAVSFLTALLSIAIFYLVARHEEWFLELGRFGPVGVAVALAIDFLIVFFAAWLVWSAAAAHHLRCNSVRRADEQALRVRSSLRDNLDSLTVWQRGFLRRFVEEGTTQIREFEVGHFKAVWGDEMQVLINKGIVRQHRRAGVYEIEPVYLNYLREHLDLASGTLS